MSNDKTMKKIGKRGRMNQIARKRIAEICEYVGLTQCEAKLPGCMGEAHGPAHRHKRRFYSTADQLSNPMEWVAACQNCHNLLEYNRELTDKVFKKCRDNTILTTILEANGK